MSTPRFPSFGQLCASFPTRSVRSINLCRQTTFPYTSYPVKMASVVTPSSAKLYYGDYVKIWAQLQSTYRKKDEDDDDKIMARRSFFRNSLLTLFAQIEAQPTCHEYMLAALTDYVTTAKHADGLESVWLTLLNIANVNN